MSELLENHLGGQGHAGSGDGTPLVDPIDGAPLVRVSSAGHGNVMPQSQHGGPGRAGGGPELGGLAALDFHLRRTALQAATPAT